MIFSSLAEAIEDYLSIFLLDDITFKLEYNCDIYFKKLKLNAFDIIFN